MTSQTGILSPAEMAKAAEDAAFGKATSNQLKSFLLALTAGGYIALGFVFFVTSQVGADGMSWGASKVLGGLVFSTGLTLVVLTGAELFTSSTLTLTARASGRITTWQLIKNWIIVYLGNFLGAMTIVALIYFARTWEQAAGGWGTVVLDVSLKKVNHDFLTAFALGVLCNLMVCLAIWAAYGGRNTVDKVAAVTLPIALFVATGFEHSVANMFIIPLGILIASFAGEGFWQASGLDPSAYGDLTWGNFFADNLLPVTLGNIVGGGVMIGILYWTIFHFLNKPGKPMPKPTVAGRPAR
ncbi:formate transporter FocA [Flaviflexus massiliensis]|uniref:formate transporter FocA n=1 Tax=Flaviflexus massiliensis TaxID=1522309 RepID=UPI0006D54C4F|nr:formate transporter FocA [Flaviflexus massiliensis]